MKPFLFAAALAAGSIGSAASASTVTVSYQPSGVFGAPNLSQTVKVETNGPGVDGRVKAGLFHLSGDDGFGDFVAFCVDLVQYLHDPTTYEIKPDLFASPVLDNIGKLFTSALGGGTIASVIDTSLEAAGFQLALWEILYDSGNGFDLTAGDFRETENVLARGQAQSYLNALGADADGYAFTFLYSATKQDVVTAEPVEPVPLPATGVLMLAGLGGLAALHRRGKRA